MNTKQQNTLRSLLKKHGYKSASTIVRQTMGINFDYLIQKSDALYVIPRLASCYGDEEKKANLMNMVYKEWLKDVVEGKWCEPLNAYIDEHGTRTVLQALYYLIDTGLWSTYEGRMRLNDVHDPTYYQLGDLPAAIEQVKELTEEQQEKVPEQQEVKPSTPGTLMDADEAMKLMDATKEMYTQFTQNFARLSDFIYTAADTDSLRSTINEQKKQIDALTKKVEDSNATMQKASDYISSLREDIKKEQTAYEELNGKYKKALDERDAADNELEACKKLLEEETQKVQLPKKKVIPFSVLIDIPLLGNGVMKGLEPVLEKYNIIVDHNK